MLIFSSYFFKDLMKNKDLFEKQTSYFTIGIIAFVTNFFDTLGIGVFIRYLSNSFLPNYDGFFIFSLPRHQ